MADKKNSSRGYVKKRIEYDGFSLSPNKTGKFCATASHGCRTKEGVLTCGLGARYLSIDGVDLAYKDTAPPIRLNFVPYHFATGLVDQPLIATATDVYYFAERYREFVIAVNTYAESDFSNIISAAGVEISVIAFKNALWAYGESEWFKKKLSGDFTKVACTYAYRLFVAGKNARLLYSNAYDYFNFTDSIDEGGYVDLLGGAGAINQLIPLQEEMYCFFDKQIFRVVAGGAARDFEAKEVAYNGGEIFAGSAAACGDEVVFLTRDGLCKVKSGKVTQIATGTPLRGLRPMVNAKAVTAEGTYILPCAVEGVGEKTLAVDLATGECSTTQHSLVTCAYHGGAYGVAEGGRLFAYQTGYPLEGGFVFERKGEPFGDARDKTLKSLTLYGEGDVELTVGGQHATRKKAFPLTQVGVVVPIGVKGKTFDVKIALKTGAHLTKLQAETLEAQ